MKYLDPKADLTFKRVFGEHPDIVMSFLNALLPLEEDEQIVEIEYLSPEMMPENPLGKFSIVDVCCKDSCDRQFIVEMQIAWYAEFRQRVLFNASKAYVRQMEMGENYKRLKPVYSLNLINEVFEPSLEGYYHHYRIVHVEHSDKVIEGLQIVFIELPKFKAKNFEEKKMRALWLRFLTEINQHTRKVSDELMAVAVVKKAVNNLETAAFNDAELRGYEKYWDAVSLEVTKREGNIEIGKEIGRGEGRVEGIEIGKLEEKLEMARKLKADNLPDELIAKYTGLSLENLEKC